MKIGIQTYTVRDEMDADFEGTLRTLREIGYEGAELCQLYGRTGEEIRRIFADLSLDLISVSFTVPDVFANPDLLPQIAAAGTKYAVISYTPEDIRRGGALWEQTVSDMNRIADTCAQLGLKLAYHNHDFEFKKHEDIYDYDDMMTRVPALYAEPDAGWLCAAGQNPVRFIGKYADRIALLHVKDIEGRADLQTLQFRAVGEGMVEWPPVLAAAQRAGAEWAIVEQDSPDCGRTPMECAKQNYQYLKQFI